MNRGARMDRADRIRKFARVDLYPVITAAFCPAHDSLLVCAKVLAGGVAIVQLREKEKTKKEIYSLAEKFRELTSAYGALLIINDYVDIALAVAADGVHLGQTDLPVAAARKLAPELLIGVSTHSREEALLAEQEGADYINIGPIFSTTTKDVCSAVLGVDQILRISQAVRLPYTVMGGINQKNINQVLRVGARKVAMITGITKAPDIQKYTERIRREIQQQYV